jgi:hypothetical protein
MDPWGEAANAGSSRWRPAGDLAEQHRFLVRYNRAVSERESRLEPRVNALESRVDELEIEIAPRSRSRSPAGFTVSRTSKRGATLRNPRRRRSAPPMIPIFTLSNMEDKRLDEWRQR